MFTKNYYSQDFFHAAANIIVTFQLFHQLTKPPPLDLYGDLRLARWNSRTLLLTAVRCDRPLPPSRITDENIHGIESNRNISSSTFEQDCCPIPGNPTAISTLSNRHSFRFHYCNYDHATTTTRLLFVQQPSWNWRFATPDSQWWSHRDEKGSVNSFHLTGEKNLPCHRHHHLLLQRENSFYYLPLPCSALITTYVDDNSTRTS